MHSDTGLFADFGCALMEDNVGADFGERKEEDRNECRVEDYLADEYPR